MGVLTGCSEWEGTMVSGTKTLLLYKSFAKYITHSICLFVCMFV